MLINGDFIGEIVARAPPCQPDACQLPDCYCSRTGTEIPGEIRHCDAWKSFCLLSFLLEFLSSDALDEFSV